MHFHISLILHILLYLAISLPVVLALYPTIHRVLGRPYDRREMLLCCLLLYANIATNRPVASLGNGLNILSATFFFFLMVRFVFRQRGVSCFVDLIKIIALLTVEEAACMLVLYLMSLLGFDQNKLMVLSLSDFYRVENMFYSSLLNLLGNGLVYLIVLLWNWVRNRSKPSAASDRHKSWMYFQIFLRIGLLVFTCLGALTLPFSLFGGQSLIRYLIENSEQYVLLSLFCAALMLVIFSYLLQDLRYVMQADRLNSMKKQQNASHELIRSLRYFRHNMANTLYGLEGIILSGDAEKLAAYYAEMRQACALVNNDNTAALEQLENPALNALLLQHIDRARQLNLPFNLYVQGPLPVTHALSDAELCQILGVLLDNAIEAADQAAERSVTVEMGSPEGALEIIVKNTYSGAVSAQTLAMGGESTKPGHEGQGLKSCYHILSRRRHAHLNLWQTGQYVQAQLLLRR